MRENLFYIFLAALIFCRASWAETFLGIKEVNPGISLTFEIAAKDTILPAPFYLPEKDTDIHVEVLAVWSDSAPAGSMVGGFVAYLTVVGEIENQNTGKTLDFELTPHINLSDNLHYAQNIKLPGDLSDLYNLSFKIICLLSSMNTGFVAIIIICVPIAINAKIKATNRMYILKR